MWIGTIAYFDPAYDRRQRGSDAAPDPATLPLYLCQCDLRCLVRTAYVLITKVAPPGATWDSHDKLAAFWAQRLGTGLWAQALAAVESMPAAGHSDTYAVLRTLLGQL
jgi:hypothetical protein